MAPWYHQGGQAYGFAVALYKRMENVIMEKIDFELVSASSDRREMWS